MFVGIHESSHSLLSLAVDAEGLFSLFFGLGEARQQQSRENRNDRNNDEQFDERKGRPGSQCRLAHGPIVAQSQKKSEIPQKQRLNPRISRIDANWEGKIMNGKKIGKRNEVNTVHRQ